MLDIPIFHKLYNLYKTLSSYHGTIPKMQRYTLWQRCENVSLALLERVISTSHLKGEERAQALHEISSNVDLLKLLIPWWFLLLIVVIPLQAQPLLTLEEVLRRVLAYNFDIQIARNEQKIAAKNHHIGKAGFLPSLDANLGLHQEHTIWPQKQNADVANLSVGLVLKWTVFNGMQRILTYQHLGKVSQRCQLATQQKIEEKVAEAITSYYRLALAQKKKHVLENCPVVSEEVLQLAKAKYEVGQCSKLAYLNAQVQHNEEQATLLL